MRIATWLTSLAAMGVLLVACGGPSSPDDGSSLQPSTSVAVSSPTVLPSPAPFEATVDNTAIGGDCLKVDCWQPTQFGPNLVELESVSLEEQATTDGKVTRAGWPNNRDKVTVLCIAKGGSYRNSLNQSVNDWYGIRIPADKVEPKAMSNPRLRKAPDGNGYMGFIGITWLTGGEYKRAPACPTT